MRPLQVGTDIAAWPGALPAPYPARVFDPPLAAELTDAWGNAITVTGRGEQPGVPARVQSRVVSGPVHGVRRTVGLRRALVGCARRQRCARWQVVVGEPMSSQVACVVVVENGRAGIEAIYD